MSETQPVGGSVIVNGDTGEVTVFPYTQEELDEINLVRARVEGLAPLEAPAEQEPEN